MEAARVAALQGHKVTLWEKKNTLGGNLIPASVPDFKDDYRLLINYLATQVNKLKVKVELEKEATPELIQRMKPDVVFVATGAIPIIPEIKGIEEGLQTGRVVTAVDLLLGKKEIGELVVVLGGGLIGCETALYLAQERGKKVTVIELLDSIARDMVWGNALDLVRLLDCANVKILTNSNALEVTDTGLIIADKQGAESTLEAETIVCAVGMKPVGESLVEALKDKLPEVYTIGDCVQPSKVLNAIWEGFRTARLI